MDYDYIQWFEDLDGDDVELVGGKGANLGEMTNAGIPVPSGFCVTADAYEVFVNETGIQDKIMELIGDVEDYEDSDKLNDTAKKIRNLIKSTEMPDDIRDEIVNAYEEMNERYGKDDVYTAVRSSATAEDLPDASFAGQQETYLDISGVDSLLDSVQKCWASLWTTRATYYRERQGFDHSKVYLSAVVQKMVNSETAGVMFTANPANNDTSEIMINASWGLGESVVSGAVSPDEYIVDKENLNIKDKHIAKKKIMIVRDPETGVGTVKVDTEDQLGEEYVEKECLDDEKIKKLAEIGIKIEDHYNAPQDIEWAYDTDTDELQIVQSRPVTTLEEKGEDEEEEKMEESEGLGEVLVKGLGASPGRGSGKVVKVETVDEIGKVEEGDVMVTTMTNPDMVPAMKRASAIVTDEGGRTSHAAIVSRELGIPCIVGTDEATKVLESGKIITVDGEKGTVYEGREAVEEKETETKEVVAQAPQPVTATEIKVNISIAEAAEKAAETGADGVGLLRAEHMVLGIGKHPQYFLQRGEEDKLIESLKDGIGEVADAFYPRRIWYRTLDAPTDEFKELEGGEDEPEEHNPMLGWRGIRREMDRPELLKTEFKAIKSLIKDEGYENIGIMLPLVANVDQLTKAKEIAKEVGLEPHEDLEFGMMIEIPAAALTIEKFIEEGIDFVSFGTNDLTQYTLAVDRNNENVAKLYNEKHPAVLSLMERVIKKCNEHDVESSICGQAASDPEMAKHLVRYGIDSLSANPDAVNSIRKVVAREEQRILLEDKRN